MNTVCPSICEEITAPSSSPIRDSPVRSPTSARTWKIYFAGKPLSAGMNSNVRPPVASTFSGSPGLALWPFHVMRKRSSYSVPYSRRLSKMRIS